MSELHFFAYGIPKGQPRVRAFRRGNHAGVFDPGTADGWKFSVKSAAAQSWNGAVFEGPLKVSMTFEFPRPKAHFLKAGLRKDAPQLHTAKPDCDNAAKAVLDALTTAGIWKDDAQVAVLIVNKCYADPSRNPGIEVRIESASVFENLARRSPQGSEKSDASRA